MDKETGELQGIIYEWLRGLHTTETQRNVKKLTDKLKKVGYRKLPEGKPPLLSDEEIDKAYGEKECGNGNLWDLCEAQREANIRWYTNALSS